MSSGRIKIVLFLVLLAIAGGLAYFFHNTISLVALAAHETELLQLLTEHRGLAYTVAFLVYVVVTSLSLPGAAVLTLLYAWLFRLGNGPLNFWPALILVSFASTAGATVAFLLSRYLFRETAESLVATRLKSLDQYLGHGGAIYLFALRLIPVSPFFLLNAVFGLTTMPTRTFAWVSQLGMLPGTIVYCYVGSRFPSLSDLSKHGIGGIFTPPVISAFVVLALFSLVVRWLMVKMRLLPPSKRADDK